MATLIIFAKAPEPGNAKTRLIPALGANGAALLARQMLHHTLEQGLLAGVKAVELCMSPAPQNPAWDSVDLPGAVRQTAQGEGDLGQRMLRAVERVTSGTPPPAVLLIGTDCPALGAAQISEAARQLAMHDVVLLPASDGGYVLIGMKAPYAQVFNNMAWSTSTVAAETLLRLAALGLGVWQGPTLTDIDEPGDLVHLPAGFTAGFAASTPTAR